MIKNIFNSLLCVNTIIFFTYYDIHLITSVCGIGCFLIYYYLYNESLNNVRFSLAIAPLKYIDPINEAHKLFYYGSSTIHALCISLFSTLYLFNIIDNYAIKQVFFFSMNYYLGDLSYIINVTKKFTKLEYFMICHHSIMIYYQLYVFIQTDPILENNLLHYINRGLLAEYSLPTLNYCWYLINTNNSNSNKFFISSIITLILYFITRIINFTLLFYNIFINGFLVKGIIMAPLFFINYYWFYKLICKANKIYKKK